MTYVQQLVDVTMKDVDVDADVIPAVILSSPAAIPAAA